MAWGAAACIVVALADPPHSDKPAAYDLQWDAPAPCPDAAAVQASIAAWVPQPAGGRGIMQVRGRVQRTDQGYWLHLETEHDGRHSARDVEAPQCSDLAESTALVVAVALDPGLASDPTTGAPSESEAVPPVVDAPVPDGFEEPGPPVASGPGAGGRARDVALRAPTERRAVAGPKLALRLAPLVEVGGLPNLGGGLELAAAMLWPRLRLELAGAHLWPRRAAEAPRGAALVQLGMAAAQACGRPRANRVEFPVCLGVEAGGLRAASRGLAPATTVLGPWVAPRGSAGVATRGPRLGVWGALQVAVPVVSTRPLVGASPAYSALPVSFRVLLGLEINLSRSSFQ